MDDSVIAETEVFIDPAAVFQKLINSPHLCLHMLDTSPIPIEIFAPDGTVIFVNKAGLEMTGCKDASLLVGEYNLWKDPVCLDIIGQEALDKVFSGEAAMLPDFSAPIQDVLDRGVIEEKPWEAATMDLYMHPIWDDGVFVCTICYFIIKRIYQGRAEIIRAQEYMDRNWKEGFDIEKIAEAANLSVYHFVRLFKEHMGMTPYDLYKQIKIDRIKEKLRDPGLNITQAFAACGTSSKGTFYRLFKESVKMTPSEYRERNLRR
jgi:AraC-like DNA-binding protein